MSINQNEVIVKFNRQQYMNFVDTLNDSKKYLHNVAPRADLDDLAKYDTQIKIDQLKWLESLVSTMNVSVKEDTHSIPRPITKSAVALLQQVKFEDPDQEEERADAISEEEASQNLLRAALDLYVERQSLIADKTFIHDALTLAIVKDATSNTKLKEADLSNSRTKRDIASLVGCMIKKETKATKAKPNDSA